MDGEERVTVRLPSDDLALLEELVLRGEFPSETEAVRAAVRELIDSRLSDAEKAEALDRAARRSELDLKDFTADGTDGERILKNVITSGSEGGDV